MAKLAASEAATFVAHQVCQSSYRHSLLSISGTVPFKILS